MSIPEQSTAILLAVVLDLLIGDPVWAYHPVRLMGRVATYLEPLLRRLSQYQKMNGLVFNLVIVISSGVLGWLLIRIFRMFDANAAFFLEVVIIYFCLALGSLTREGWRSAKLLSRGKIEEARACVQNLVSRDLSQENERGIMRALIESLTENISDGVVAPLFFAMLGGAPLVLMYKAINTLDSMVGYKNEKYCDFGWFSARLDDVVNLIPARLTGFAMVLTALILARHPIYAIRAWIHDAQRGPSPNGGIPIVVFAGAMDITLGGNCFSSDGSVIAVPNVGGRRLELNNRDVSWAIIFCYCSSALVLGGYLILMLIV